MSYTVQWSINNHVSTKIILLFRLALDETYAVFKISFATMLHAIGAHTGSDIFHFVVFFLQETMQNISNIGNIGNVSL